MSAHAQTPVSPTPDQLAQILRSQPAVDITAPVTASAFFDPPLVQLGEKSIYRIIVNATEVSVQLPAQLAAPPQLKFRQSASGQNMQSVDRTIQMFTTFDYDVRATESGSFTVPEYTVEVYGKPVSVPAAQLEVRNELPQPHEPVRQLFVEPLATNVFAGQAFNVRVLLPASAGNRIEGVSQLELNGDGFLVQKNPIRQIIQTVKKDGRPVPTYIYETVVTPIATGQLQLRAQGFTSGMQFSGPVTLTGQVVISGGPPQFSLLDSDPVIINVQPLPAGNELPGFTGLVGDYTCDPPGLTTNTVKAGEPVQLTVIIRSQQDLTRVNPPLPVRVPGWQIFPAVRKGFVAGTNPGVGFAYTLIPLTADLRATPAIPFSSFDPVLEKYVDLTIPPVPITILPGGTTADADESMMLAENASESEQKPGLSGIALSPGHTTNSLVPLPMRPWFPLVQLLPLAVFCELWYWDRRRRHLEQHPEIIRRRQARRALRRERRLLKQSAVAGDAAGFTHCAVHALQIVSAPHYPAVPRALVCGDVLQILTPQEREGKPGEVVRRFFAAADAQAFASNAEMHAGLFAEQPDLQDLLTRLEARL